MNFNAHKDLEQLKETRVEVTDNRFADAVQDMQEANQRAQTANHGGRLAPSQEFDALKEALNLQRLEHYLQLCKASVPAAH